MTWLELSLAAVGLSALLLLFWRLADSRTDRAVWNDLRRRAGKAGPAFDPSMIKGLPQPAQRYFRYTIAPGTPIVSVVELEMEGLLGLGNEDEPAYRSMTARQILVPPMGLVWRVKVGMISGSDGATPETSWTRFWLRRLIPIVRVSRNADHHRSAFGRVVSEGAFWVPASLLPGHSVTWEPVDENTARAIVSYGGNTQAIELTIEPDGRPSRIVIQRWSNENDEREFREQPFGGYLSDFREIGGYRLPMHVEGGNLIGTEDYFPFYKVDIKEVRLPQLTDRPDEVHANQS